jgi:hypothetical protein
MKTYSELAKFVVVSVAFSSLCSCQSLNRAAKPDPAAPSAFLSHPKEMKEDPKRSPFMLNWTNPSPNIADAAKQRTEIYIAPVSVEFLRPISKSVSRLESGDASQKVAARKLADMMRNEFMDVFKKSPQRRYQPVPGPSKNSLTLELAFVELNPNSISAGTFRTAVNVVAVPGLDNLFGRPLKSNIAIEGRLRDSSTGESIYEFADNEEAKSSLVFTFNDFTTYGTAREAIRDWAEQFEELTRTPKEHRVKDSSAFVLLPW